MSQRMIKTAFVHLLWASSCVCASLSLAAGPVPVAGLASPAPAPAVAPAASAPAKTYTVVAGDNLDKVVRQQYPNSPLRPDILKDAVMQQNPSAFTKGSNKMLMVGYQLTVPDHQELLRKHMPALGGAPAAAAEAANAGQANADQRRNWIRYP